MARLSATKKRAILEAKKQRRIDWDYIEAVKTIDANIENCIFDTSRVGPGGLNKTGTLKIESQKKIILAKPVIDLMKDTLPKSKQLIKVAKWDTPESEEQKELNELLAAKKRNKRTPVFIEHKKLRGKNSK
jgi:hypothetical protein